MDSRKSGIKNVRSNSRDNLDARLVSNVQVAKKPKRSNSSLGVDSRISTHPEDILTKDGKGAITRAYIGQANFIENYFLPEKGCDLTALDIMRDMFKEAKILARETKMQQFADIMKLQQSQTVRRPKTTANPCKRKINMTQSGNDYARRIESAAMTMPANYKSQNF